VAFNVFFNIVTCDSCHKDHEVMIKISVDYDKLILCDKCLLAAKKQITSKKKELKDERKNRK